MLMKVILFSKSKIFRTRVRPAVAMDGGDIQFESF